MSKNTLLVSDKTRIGTQTPFHSLPVTSPTSSEKTGEKDALGPSPTETHLDVSMSGNEGRAMIAVNISVYSEVFRGSSGQQEKYGARFLCSVSSSERLSASSYSYSVSCCL